MKKKATPFEMAETKNLPDQFSNKLLVCLHHLYQCGRSGLNTLEVWSSEDVCFHTTAYQLEQVLNIRPQREFMWLVDSEGEQIPFMRYWLSDEQREIVAEILGYSKTGGVA